MLDKSAGWCVGLSYCLHIWWLDDVSLFKEHSLQTECFTFMDHALLLFIVFFFYRPSPMAVTIKLHRMCKRNWMLSFREFPTHPWKCCHQLKTFSQHHVVTYQKVVGFYMNWVTSRTYMFIHRYIFVVNWVLTAFKMYSDEVEWKQVGEKTEMENLSFSKYSSTSKMFRNVSFFLSTSRWRQTEAHKFEQELHNF